MALGGLVSSGYAGLACPEWPTCNGGSWFPSWRGSVGLHLMHRSNGYLLLLVLCGAAFALRADPRVGRATSLAAALGLAQVAAGVANVRLGLPIEVTALHSALAALLVLTVGWSLRAAWPRRDPL
jgi:cytochrome c oxidase assembly protein subunit 15